MRKPKGRRFGHGELHLALLALLAKQPMHGYELMTELATRMGPRYHPSPGSIYPAVSALYAEGLVDADEQTGRRVYRLTPIGEAALQTRLDDLARIEEDLQVKFSDDSADAAIARFARRARELAPSVAAADLEAALARTISTLENLAKEDE